MENTEMTITTFPVLKRKTTTEGRIDWLEFVSERGTPTKGNTEKKDSRGIVLAQLSDPSGCLAKSEQYHSQYKVGNGPSDKSLW